MAQKVESHMKYNDGTLKINTEFDSYIFKEDFSELTVVKERPETLNLLYSEDHIEAYLMYSDNIYLSSDDTGIYLYFYDVIVAKYGRE